jgi:hypothetical protein
LTADRPEDAALAAVLLAKPVADDVPLAVWWFLAESLRHSVRVRRAIEGVESLGAATFRLEVSRALTHAEAALEEIDQRAVGSVPGDDADRPHPVLRNPTLRNNATLRVTICALARLMVKSRTVTTIQLRATILAHLQALRSVTP